MNMQSFLAFHRRIEMKKMESGKQDLEAMIPAVILPDGYRGKIGSLRISIRWSSMKLFSV